MPTRTTTLRAVRRAIEDEELQGHLRNAFVAARKLNSTISNNQRGSHGGVAPRIVGLAGDRRAQSELKVLVEELGATAGRIAATPRKQPRRRFRRIMLLVGTAAAAYMLFRRFTRSARPRVSPASPGAPA